MKYLKFAAFSLVTAIAVYIVELITHFEMLYLFVILAGIACVGSLIVCLCTKIFNRFAYSVNVIVIIACAAVAVIAYTLQPEKMQIVNLSDLASLSIFSLVALIAVMGVLVSTLVLVWRLLFRKKEEKPVSASQNLESSENMNL